MKTHRLLCAILFTASFGLSAPLQANESLETNSQLQLAEWWWDADGYYGMDRCRCPCSCDRFMPKCECDALDPKYREACYKYRAKKCPCSCPFEYQS